MLDFEYPLKEVVDFDNAKDEDLSLERLFLDHISINIVEFIDISNKFLEIISFDWLRSDEFE